MKRTTSVRRKSCLTKTWKKKKMKSWRRTKSLMTRVQGRLEAAPIWVWGQSMPHLKPKSQSTSLLQAVQEWQACTSSCFQRRACDIWILSYQALTAWHNRGYDTSRLQTGIPPDSWVLSACNQESSANTLQYSQYSSDVKANK